MTSQLLVIVELAACRHWSLPRRPLRLSSRNRPRSGPATRSKIDFTVDRTTDVAVTIEDAKGKIIRHLAAGVLGKNPPEPLQADSLAQSLDMGRQGRFRQAGQRADRSRSASSWA